MGETTLEIPNVVLPKQNGKISLNKVGLYHNTISDNLSTKGENYKYINDTYNGNTKLSLQGNILGGKYRAEANAYHYRNDTFMFGGVTATYLNNFVDKKSGITDTLRQIFQYSM